MSSHAPISSRICSTKQYARNTFLFNVSFVLRAHADPTPYEPILRKLALTLHTLEVESEFIFRPEKKAHLNNMFQRVLMDLSARKECLLALDEANLLSLKLTRVVQVGREEISIPWARIEPPTLECTQNRNFSIDSFTHCLSPVYFSPPPLFP